jgi:hypothetical protein
LSVVPRCRCATKSHVEDLSFLFSHFIRLLSFASYTDDSRPAAPDPPPPRFLSRLSRQRQCSLPPRRHLSWRFLS